MGEKIGSGRKLRNLLRAFDGHPFVFWICPRGCRGRVKWKQTGKVLVATCVECGEKSNHYRAKGYFVEEE